MSNVITLSGVTRQDGNSGHADIDRFPDHCPVRHAGIEPIKQESAHYHTGDRRLELVFRCPREKCQSLFVARYFTFGYSGALTYRGAYPFEPYDEDFSDHIRKISPQFCVIANEAQKAHQSGWKMVAGPGYRKALEFLIKDYLCLAQPNDAEQIKKSQLGPCINTYVQNEKVKAMAHQRLARKR